MTSQWQRLRLLFLLSMMAVVLNSIANVNAAFVSSPQHSSPLLQCRYPPSLFRLAFQKHDENNQKDKDDNDNGEDMEQTLDKIQDWLDTPFFDPDQYDDDERNDSSFPSKFAKLVKNDYELAEAIYAGGFLYLMIVVSQELLRWQMQGDKYLPFTSSGGGGFHL